MERLASVAVTRQAGQRLLFLGSVTWLETAPPVAVSRSGVTCSGLQAAFGPEELLRAWRPPR